MLVEIDNKIISTDLFSKKFVCDLNACKGACCIEGDGGAPLKLDEVEQIKANYEAIKPFMAMQGRNVVEKKGVSYIDANGENATNLVNNKECVFVYFDDTNTAKCSIEKAFRNGAIPFNKPISCHLYPIRVKEFDNYQALNFEEWKICEPACECGSKLDIPVYRFLKEPIIRAFGENFYEELQIVESELNNKK